jgi:hypothetical protein
LAVVPASVVLLAEEQALAATLVPELVPELVLAQEAKEPTHKLPQW